MNEAYDVGCEAQEPARATRPFAASDARMASGAKTLRDTTSPMDKLAMRLEVFTQRMNNDMHGVAGNLESHADRLLGPVPERVNEERGYPPSEDFGDGILAIVFSNLDNLEHQYSMAMERLSIAAGRNSTLA